MLRLSLYFARRYATMVGMCLLGLVVLVTGTTLVENAGGLARDEQGALSALRVAALSSVEFAYLYWPLAAFLGALATGTQLGRQGEWVAVGAGGASPWRLYLPFVAVVGTGALLMGACGEVALPAALLAKQHTLERFRARDAASVFFAQRNPWFADNDQLLYLPEVDLDSQTFVGPTVYHLRAGRIVGLTRARTLVYRQRSPAGWWLVDAERHDLHQPQVSRGAEVPLQLQVTPRDLIDITGNPRLMGYSELGALIRRRQHGGFNATSHRLERHMRLAQPLSALVLVVLALPWATSPNRRRTQVGSLGAGVAVMATYLTLQQICRLLALGRVLHPALAAWCAPLALLGVGWGWRRLRPSP